MKYIVAFDQGTTSSRAVLFDENRKILDITQREFKQIFPNSGWVEHDPEEIWDSQLGVFEELVEKNNLKPTDIATIGITNQRETAIVWDKSTGKPIHNAIVWQDKRTAPFCEQLKADGLEEYVKANTGLVIDSYFSGTKVHWLLENMEGAKEKAVRGDLLFGTVDTWLIWKMTKGKNHVTDHTNASRTLLYNIRHRAWDDTLLEAMDVPKQMLPSVQPSSSDFGIFHFRGTDIPICGVAGDQQAALFGQACFQPGSAKNTYGTGCFLLVNTGSELYQSENGILSTLACSVSEEAVYAQEGSVFIAGAAIQWLRDGLKIIENAPQSESLAQLANEEHGLFLVPAFVGLGAPYWDMYARGAIFGLTRATTREDFVRATLESLAYQTKDVIDAMQEDTGLKINNLKVDGGAAANNLLMQFQADILGVTVERPESIETTATGAAYLAGLNKKIWSLEELRQHRPIDNVFEPKMAKERSMKLYKGWKAAVKRTMNWEKETQ